MVLRISRADIGNTLFYSNDVVPPIPTFDIVGYTYPNDPRTIYSKCIQYLGDEEYPLNIIAYIKIDFTQ